MRRLTLLATLFVCVGCASVNDPGGFGYGQYFQLLDNNRVVAERDTAQVGMINCQHYVRQLAQANPAIAPRIRCSDRPTTEPLPFSLRLRTRNPEQLDLQRHEPQLYRFASKALCLQSVPKSGPREAVGAVCETEAKP